MAFSWVSTEPDLYSVDSEILIEPTPQGCLVRQQQYFRGELAPGHEPRVGDRNDLGLEMMNAALKARAER
jgi:hypothetical protein